MAICFNYCHPIKYTENKNFYRFCLDGQKCYKNDDLEVFKKKISSDDFTSSAESFVTVKMPGKHKRFVVKTVFFHSQKTGFSALTSPFLTKL
jgi:hypothetical protein